MGDFRVWSSQISWKSNAEENQGCRSADLIFHLIQRLYGFIMLHNFSCADCLCGHLQNMCKFSLNQYHLILLPVGIIVITIIMIIVIIAWQNVCMWLKPVAALSLSLSLRAGTLVLADQQPSRNKKLHRGKNRANPGFKAWALVGRLCTGLGPHWAHPVMWPRPNRPFCPVFLQIIHPERRGSVSLHGRSYRTGDANRMCAKEVKVASISGQIFAKQRLNGASCQRSEPGVTFQILRPRKILAVSTKRRSFANSRPRLQICDVENSLSSKYIIVSGRRITLSVWKSNARLVKMYSRAQSSSRLNFSLG